MLTSSPSSKSREIPVDAEDVAAVIRGEGFGDGGVVAVAVRGCGGVQLAEPLDVRLLDRLDAAPAIVSQVFQFVNKFARPICKQFKKCSLVAVVFARKCSEMLSVQSNILFNVWR